MLSKTQEKAASSLTEVTWLGKKVPVHSEKVRVCLVRLQQVEGELVSGEEKIRVRKVGDGVSRHSAGC